MKPKKPRQPQRSHLALFVLYLLALAGCSTARMPLPETLATAERMQVSGRQGFKIKESIAFGPYDVIDIDRSWVKGGDVRTFGFEQNSRSQRFTFRLRDTGVARWFGSCEAYLRKNTVHTDIVDVEVTNRSEVTCYLSIDGDADVAWTLALKEKGERPLEGYLSNESKSLTVTGTRKLAGGLPAETETGYEISSGTRTVAAVEVIGSGAVWLTENESADREILAASASIFLLLEDLRDHLSD